MGELSKLPNIGKVVEEQLCAAGVSTAEELKMLGSRTAWLRIQSIDPTACLHRLLALEGAVRGVRKVELPPEIKAELRAYYNAHKV
jgi:DNA transformation protein